MESVLTHHGQLVERVKKVPILVNYTIPVGRKEKTFSKSDAKLLKKVESHNIPGCCPSVLLDKQSEQYKRDAWHLRGIETASDFYTKRNLIALGALWERTINTGEEAHALHFWLT